MGEWGGRVGLRREARIWRDGIRGMLVMDKGYVCAVFLGRMEGNLWKPDGYLEMWLVT